LQLLFAFIVLTLIMSIAIILLMLSKNSRSHKVKDICQQHNWQYQEFVNFSDNIKRANFALLNYSQNAIFRHVMSADNTSFGLGFNFFDCRAIEPSGVHNSSCILFNLILGEQYQSLHISIRPAPRSQQKDDFTHICQQQKLVELPHFALKKQQVFTNQPGLAESFIQQHLNQAGYPEEFSLVTWLLAHPHLHIEISNGMLLAHQPNKLLDDEVIYTAIEQVAQLSQSLSEIRG
jgi:hypothetical protein